jgi:hypothetical protein
MGVEHHRPLRSRHPQLAVERGRRPLARREALDREAAAAEHLGQAVGVALDVRHLGGDVGQREQVRELAHDLLLVRRAPDAHLVAQAGLLRPGRHRGRGQQDEPYGCRSSSGHQRPPRKCNPAGRREPPGIRVFMDA